MNFEVGSKYYTRRHGVATIKKWSKKGQSFKAIVEIKAKFINVRLRESAFALIKYNELGDAIDPKDKAFDLMTRCKEISHY